MHEFMLDFMFNHADSPHSNIWQYHYGLIGIGACNHATLGNMTVLNYAQSFANNEETREYLEQLQMTIDGENADLIDEPPGQFIDNYNGEPLALSHLDVDEEDFWDCIIEA